MLLITFLFTLLLLSTRVVRLSVDQAPDSRVNIPLIVMKRMKGRMKTAANMTCWPAMMWKVYLDYLKCNYYGIYGSELAD